LRLWYAGILERIEVLIYRTIKKNADKGSHLAIKRLNWDASRSVAANEFIIKFDLLINYYDVEKAALLSS
jgi:hypothetical protein